MGASEPQLKLLMLQGLEGDAAAYRVLLTALTVRLRVYFARRLAEPADVEDLVQDALIAIHTRRASYDRAQPFTPWVYAVARYKLVDHFRRRRLTVPIDEAEELAAPEAEVGLAQDLEGLLAELPAKQRDAILATKVEGLSVAETAARTGLSESAVKVSVHRGLKRLADSWRGR